ncbi:MAG TPA: glycoside hydrolase family 15 protein [Acidimicrobiia bacterium]|nr:glycoside hydrolase family 15 protein [Acidimicrobiia bacterium]
MSKPIEDYALIGDTETAALVARDGSIDWLCLPRFDSGACLAALLGDETNGRWRLAPRGGPARTRRRYRPGTLVLETEMDADGGTVRIIDLMPIRGRDGGNNADVVRIVDGLSGRVEMRMDLTIRFDYGHLVPWVTGADGHVLAVGGPDALTLTTPIPLHGEDLTTVAEFAVSEGDRVPFVLTWHPSHLPEPPRIEPGEALETTEKWWQGWSDLSSYHGEWEEAVDRSLITLKALTYVPTGGVVAAPTTSLPEHLGGSRNWDYRYVWLRDATFTLQTLMMAGHRQEAIAWRDWLLRAVAGDPDDLQIMYGLAGERRLPELELDWLPGYESSRPVRIGNAAHQQIQVDVYGELMDAIFTARRMGVKPEETVWDLQKLLLEKLEGKWAQPDHGLWEVRGEPRHFTHSRLMAWVAFDRAVKCVEQWDLEGPTDLWRRLRSQIRADIEGEGYDADRNTFTQSYRSRALDASLLLIPLVGFLPPTDSRVHGTIDAVERELSIDDTLVLRYRTDMTDDGLPGDEGGFLLCSFWMVDALAMIGRRDEARRRFERLLDLRNDVGLLAEEYDPVTNRMLGNFPQAFSHLGLIDSAFNLMPGERGPAGDRAADS